MGKQHGKPRQAHRHHHDFSEAKNKFSRSGLVKKSAPSNPSRKGKQPQHVKAVVPFRPSDHILLVGEGDFSFALSLIEHHKCKYVTATCYDSEEVLHQKYPQAGEILQKLLSHNGLEGSAAQRYLEPTEKQALLLEEPIEQIGVDANSSSEWEGLSPSSSSDTTHATTNIASSLTNELESYYRNDSPHSNISFHPSISANNLPKYKPVRRNAPYNKIVFNFPHVGGLSRDVNRQVRANQELLVAFFESCRSLLASKSKPVPSGRYEASERPNHEEIYEGSNSDQDQEENENARATGEVIVSLFDGEPYTLWNIRDLARHSGFQVVTSWRFPWKAYPGYRHARTVGKIRRKTNGREVDEQDGLDHKKRGAWRGEEREARGFVFKMVEEEYGEVAATNKGKTKPQVQSKPGPSNKRKRSSSSDESDV
ncbi:hypothetical protein GJ744_009213 [Endocarpon pusillum]|uniref:25S rRNA (uridine-N(3))-methyltransferase BMT5-like domain-containing protein n=1 Tax=Endocarpon pusillum TaxID=364733 RepID=A0A8H7AG32_9EURO|nr:hypothetical protein GJ744_009213 [Endocarpon pusillum]